jgi:type II secretory pathway component PulL
MFFSSVKLAHILPAVASIDPCAQQQKLVKLVLPVENVMYSSMNLDGGYMKRSFVCSQWFLLSSETSASRVNFSVQ